MARGKPNLYGRYVSCWVRLGILAGMLCWVLPGVGWAEPAGRGSFFDPGWKAAPLQPLPASKGASREVVVAVTSDLRGVVLGDELDTAERAVGLAYLAPLIADLRSRHPALLLVDGGNAFHGTPSLAWHLATQPEKIPLLLQAMNRLGYGAMTLGNHDLSLGLLRLARWRKGAAFPWLAGNVVSDGMAGDTIPAGTLLAPAYRIFEIAGVRVGVLGLVTPGIHAWVDQEILAGWQAQEMLQAAEYWLKVLRETARADIVVGLIHAGMGGGYDRDTAVQNGLPLPNAAAQLAALGRDGPFRFDLIISGHSQRRAPRRPTSGQSLYATPVLQPGGKGEALGLARIQLVGKQGRWQVVKVQRETLLAATRADKAVAQSAQPVLDKTQAWLSEPTAAVFVKQGNWAGAYTRKNPAACAGALSHQAAVQAARPMGHDGEVFSLLPTLWRHFGWQPNSAGSPVTRRDLFRWIPYDNPLVLAQVTARQAAMLLAPYIRWQERLTVRPTMVLHPGGLAPQTEKKGTAVLALHNAQGGALPDHDLIPVVLTNYLWNGAGGLARKALLQPEQKLAATTLGLRAWMFRVLSDRALPVPKACRRLLAKPPK